jgi:hypothetical protein
MALDAGKSFEDAVVRIKRKTAVVVKTHQLTTVYLDRPPIRAWSGPVESRFSCSPLMRRQR